MVKTSKLPILHFLLLVGTLFATTGNSLLADLSVPALFDDHMVFQRDKPLKVWGHGEPGEMVEVRLGDESSQSEADTSGNWIVSLPPFEAGGPYTLTIKGNNTLVFEDILIGEVWVASGQSNMGWTVSNSINGDLKKITVQNYPQIRTIRVKNRGSQAPQWEVDGEWKVASPDTIGGFSAVAYPFAETLHAALNIPIGIIDNAWGGSSAEAWVSRSSLIANPVLAHVHEDWLEIEATFDYAAEMEEWKVQVEDWKIKSAEAEASGETVPRKPREPRDRMTAQHRPANLWNGRLKPIMPFEFRGVIWYQGETNAGRAIEYRTLFPLLIQEWRSAWGSDFPFYWVQLADFKGESSLEIDEGWPLLREAQTMTLEKLSNTGQAVIIDLGEGKDIHPRHKDEVGYRLARWALNKDYGFTDLHYRSPELASWKQEGDSLVLKFDYIGGGLRPFDTKEVQGFAIQKSDGEWEVVTGMVTAEDTVEIELESDSKITAIRFAWANNPIFNLFSKEGLPVTPFRTDVE